MSNEASLLDRVGIASPCPASWNDMEGDDRVRFCRACKLNVFNLSAMSRAEVEALVLRREGRLCVSYFRRRDGTVLTADCPVGLHVARIKLFKSLGVLVAILVGIFSYTASDAVGQRASWSSHLRWLRPFVLVYEHFAPPRWGGAMIVTPPNSTSGRADVGGAR